MREDVEEVAKEELAEREEEEERGRGGGSCAWRCCCWSKMGLDGETICCEEGACLDDAITEDEEDE